MSLYRYEIRHPDGQLSGGFHGVIYDDRSWAQACCQHQLTVEQARVLINTGPHWELPYPDLPEGNYECFFTEEGDRLFRSALGHVTALAAAIYAGGELIVRKLETESKLVVYSDQLQVVFSPDDGLSRSFSMLGQC